METVSWGVAAPAVNPAFVTSRVEATGVFTIVLAVRPLREWRSAALVTIAAPVKAVPAKVHAVHVPASGAESCSQISSGRRDGSDAAARRPKSIRD